MPNKFAYTQWLSLLRKILLLLIAFLLIRILFSVAGFSVKKARKVESFSNFKNQAVSVLENFQTIEFSGGQRKIVLRGQKFSLDAAGDQYLEGQVEMVDEGGPEKIVLQAQKAVIKPGEKKLEAEGGIEIKAGDLIIRAQVLEYDLDRREFSSSETSICEPGLNLVAKKVYYNFARKLAVLEGGKGERVIAPDLKISLAARKIRYDREKNLLLAENLDLNCGQLQVHSGSSKFYWKKKESNLEKIELEGETTFAWHEMRSNSDFNQIGVSCKKMSLLFSDSRPLIKVDNSFQIKSSGPLWVMEGSGAELQVIFSSDQRAEKFLARKARIKFLKKEGGEFVLSGEQLEHDLLSGNLLVQEKVRGIFQDYLLLARSLHFRLADLSFEAEESQLEIKAGYFEKATFLFNSEEPVFLSGFQLLAEPGAIQFIGKVRMWQGKNYFLTDRAIIEKESGRVVLKNRVQGSLFFQNSGFPTKNIRFMAEIVELKPEEKKLRISQQVNFQMNDLKIQAEEVNLNFAEEKREELSTFEASGQVSVFWKDYRARSQKARFQADKNILLLYGQAELINLNGDRLLTDKLTLFLADDRIQAESQKRERSETILVRGK